MLGRFSSALVKTRGNHVLCRTSRAFSVQSVPKSIDDFSSPSAARTDPEWVNAKPFSEVPRLSTISFILNFLPGGKYHNLSLIGIHRAIRTEYGPIAYQEGYLKRRGMLFVFEPEHFEQVFRSDGPWPSRQGLDTLTHFRRNVRPDVFKNAGGLMTEQGKSWADFRTLANPLLLKPKNLNYYIPQIDQIASDFLKRIKNIRDPKTLELPDNFESESNRWSLESVSAVALNTRLGLLNFDKTNIRGEKLTQHVKDFFQLSYELDLLPSIWKYYETPKLKRLMKAFNGMTDISLECINETKARIQANPGIDDHSILAQLLKQNEHAAIVMAMDLLIAGIDTTTSALLSCVYRLAKNPDKQEHLRKEVLKVLPNKNDPVTEETLRNLPYLRSCIKETLRVTAIASGTLREISQDLVLAGYQVPKGTNILMASMLIANDSNYFPDANKFMPERWLRNDIEDVKACPMAKSKNPYAYTPFGFGPRMCVGKRLAEMEVETMLLKIIRNFKVEWHYPDIKYRNNLISTPSGDLKFKLIDIS